MKIGITYRLFLAILAAAGMAVISLVLIMQWNLSRGFLRFINSVEKTGVARLSTKLEDSYGKELNWDFLLRDPALWRRMVMASLPEEGHPPPEGLPDGPPPEHAEGDKVQPPKLYPPPMALHFDQRVFLLDAKRNVLIGHTAIPADSDATPLRYKGNIVGYLGLLPSTRISDAHQQRFMKEQKLAFALVAGVIVLLAAGLSLLMARRLLQPLRQLADATHRLAAGEFSARVQIASNDELGQLSADFNALALTLENNELARRQWVADISHELRTPLAILRGEIEALQDGVRLPTPDSIHSLHNETLRLGRLVDDLYQLSMSDVGALTYRKKELDLAVLTAEAMEAYLTEFTAKEIELTSDLTAPGIAGIFGDAERLHQLVDNLLDNALKYTDAGGILRVSMQCRDNKVILDFQDSAPAVPEPEIEKLFERLYRVESSRNRAMGGAGLGLAICRNIVHAHDGSIVAQQSPLGGLWIRIELPRTGSSI